jgi:hypothetical protein
MTLYQLKNFCSVELCRKIFVNVVWLRILKEEVLVHFIVIPREN